MVTKDKIKAEIDKLPESLLDQVYLWLKKFTSTTTESPKSSFTIRDFNGKLDNVDVRSDAYE
jgi:hypothetical protein